VMGLTDDDGAGPHSEAAELTSGYLFVMAGGPISLPSKKQPCVALSSTESEYFASSLVVQEAVWLLRLIELHQPVQKC
jgi:hypothetical protein